MVTRSQLGTFTAVANRFANQFDAIVLVLGNRACNSLVHELSVDHTVYSVGDAVAPRRIFNAIWEAEQLARQL